MPLSKHRYIVIEGPIGAGKTSLAKRLAAHLKSALLLEQPADNPFLEKFYGDISRYALPTQLFFLFQRAAQVQELSRPARQPDMFGLTTVSDFLLDKDSLFAQLTLNEAEHRLYRQIYQHLQPQAPAPDLVIYLQAQPQTLISRVQQRGHLFEKNISAEYLLRLADGYTRFFHEYDAAPVLIVNSDNLNFVDNTEDFDLLLQRANAMRGAREYFNRGL